VMNLPVSRKGAGSSFLGMNEGSRARGWGRNHVVGAAKGAGGAVVTSDDLRQLRLSGIALEVGVLVAQTSKRPGAFR
jgi:hypothetical protein